MSTLLDLAAPGLQCRGDLALHDLRHARLRLDTTLAAAREALVKAAECDCGDIGTDIFEQIGEALEVSVEQWNFRRHARWLERDLNDDECDFAPPVRAALVTLAKALRNHAEAAERLRIEEHAVLAGLKFSAVPSGAAGEPPVALEPAEAANSRRGGAVEAAGGDFPANVARMGGAK